MKFQLVWEICIVGEAEDIRLGIMEPCIVEKSCRRFSLTIHHNVEKRNILESDVNRRHFSLKVTRHS